jgi:hypothetical protein
MNTRYLALRQVVSCYLAVSDVVCDHMAEWLDSTPVQFAACADRMDPALGTLYEEAADADVHDEAA